MFHLECCVYAARRTSRANTDVQHLHCINKHVHCMNKQVHCINKAMNKARASVICHRTTVKAALRLSPSPNLNRVGPAATDLRHRRPPLPKPKLHQVPFAPAAAARVPHLYLRHGIFGLSAAQAFTLCNYVQQNRDDGICNCATWGGIDYLYSKPRCIYKSRGGLLFCFAFSQFHLTSYK